MLWTYSIGHIDLEPTSSSGSGASGLSLDFSTVNHVMCVTHGTVLHASATVMELNCHMRGVWNTAFVNFTTQLLNARWLQSWSGSLALSVLGILGLGLCVWVAMDGQYFGGRMPPKTGNIRGLFPMTGKVL